MSYSSLLVKLSGEALGGKAGAGIDADSLHMAASEVAEVVQSGVGVALVVGAGNIFRGRSAGKGDGYVPISRLTADRMGMLGTVINALAFHDALKQIGLANCVLTPEAISGATEPFSVELGRRRLKRGEVVICAGGTGNPLFTTDTAACLRGIELGVELIAKATMADGIFDQDPALHADATRFDQITHDEVIRQELRVIDLTAVILCRDHAMPLLVYNMANRGALARIVKGDAVGTLVTVDGDTEHDRRNR